MFTFDTHNACLERPCFGEIRYREKGQKPLLVPVPSGRSVITGLFLCSMMASTSH